MKALLTGVTGFVGSHLAQHLCARDDAVLGIARSSQWPAEYPAALRSMPLALWDLSRDERPDDLARRLVVDFAPDMLFHLAAVSVPAVCGRDVPTPEALATNVEGTRRVLELAQSLPRPPRVVFMSSSHVYAPVAVDHPTVAEDAPLGPVNAYGHTKLTGERLCAKAGSHARLEVVVVRSFILSGPRQDGRLMLPEWAAQFVRGKSPIQVRSLDRHA